MLRCWIDYTKCGDVYPVNVTPTPSLLIIKSPSAIQK